MSEKCEVCDKILKDDFAKRAHQRLSKDRVHRTYYEEHYQHRKTKGAENSDSAIDQIRTMEKKLEGMLASKELKEIERKEWEQKLVDLQTLLQLEVDEILDGEVARAIKKRDKEWQKLLEDYVKKEVAAKLRTTIADLKKSIEDKNTTIWNLGQENKKFVSDLQYLQNENIELAEQNGDLSNYIGFFLEDAGRREGRIADQKINALAVEVRDFNIYKHNWVLELDEREEKLDKKSELNDEQERNLDKKQKELNALDRELKDIKMRQDVENQRFAGWESRLKEKESHLKREKEDIRRKEENLNLTRDEALKIRQKEMEKAFKEKEKASREKMNNLKKIGLSKQLQVRSL